MTKRCIVPECKNCICYPNPPILLSSIIEFLTDIYVYRFRRFMLTLNIRLNIKIQMFSSIFFRREAQNYLQGYDAGILTYILL